jgi:hypothetical protein
MKQVHKLFSVVGWKLKGHAMELIVAKSEADAEDYAVLDVRFVEVGNTSLVSDCVHVAVQARSNCLAAANSVVNAGKA